LPIGLTSGSLPVGTVSCGGALHAISTGRRGPYSYTGQLTLANSLAVGPRIAAALAASFRFSIARTRISGVS
jgi:hypothetical protein